MKRILVAMTGVLALAAHAQPLADAGRLEFETSCSGCHGLGARGDGPVARYLTRAPSDLTTLSRRNGGVFPSQRIYETIDGRTSIEIGPHGSREMPIWGRVYRSLAMEPGAGEASPGITARGRMAALMDYLVRIQAN
ncbi:MAG: hypothetical protein U1F56_24195 [Rubrivivax sp.]